MYIIYDSCGGSFEIRYFGHEFWMSDYLGYLCYSLYALLSLKCFSEFANLVVSCSIFTKEYWKLSNIGKLWFLIWKSLNPYARKFVYKILFCQFSIILIKCPSPQCRRYFRGRGSWTCTASRRSAPSPALAPSPPSGHQSQTTFRFVFKVLVKYGSQSSNRAMLEFVITFQGGWRHLSTLVFAISYKPVTSFEKHPWDTIIPSTYHYILFKNKTTLLIIFKAQPWLSFW